MQLSERIAEAIKQSGKSFAEIARATKRTNAAVTQWIDGSTKTIKGETAAALEVATGYRAQWLITGRGPKRIADDSNVEPVHPRRRIPVISWIRAGSWSDAEQAESESDEWIDVYDTMPGESSFALRIVGDSMTSPYPNELSFPPGTTIVVDPGRSASAGDYVVAKDIETNQATFKKLVHDAGRWYLKPLNPTYPTQEIDDPAIRVIGRVIEFQTRGKL